MLLPFQGDYYSYPTPRALPWAKCSLAFQAIAVQVFINLN